MSALLAGRHAVAHSSIMMRADVLRQVGGYWSLPFGEEYDLMLRIGEVAQLANLDRVLLHYRVHQASMNGSAMRRMRTSIDYACELARRRRSGAAAISHDAFLAQRAARPMVAANGRNNRRPRACPIPSGARRDLRRPSRERAGPHGVGGGLPTAFVDRARGACVPAATASRYFDEQ